MQSLGNIFKYKLLFLLVFFTNISIKDIYSSKNSYQKLEELYLNSFKVELQEHDYLSAYNQETNSVDNEKLHEIIHQKFTGPRNNTQIILNLFKKDNSSKPNTEAEKRVKTSNKLYENLEIFCGQNISSSHLLSKIDRTQSYAGRITLSKMLLEPTYNVQELQNRQEIIKALLNNNNVKILENIIKEYKKHEETLLHFFDKKEFNKMFGSENYFPNAIPILNVLPDNILQATGIIDLSQKINGSTNLLDLLNLYNLFSAALNINTLITEGIPSNIKNIKDKIHDLKNISPWKFWEYQKVGYHIGKIPLDISIIASTLKAEQKKYTQVKQIHEKLSKISKIITSSDKIKTFILFNKNLSDKFSEFKELENYFNDITKQDYLFNKLLNSLRSQIYSKENANFIELFFLRGKILQTAYLLASTQKYLVKFIKAIGQVDAYLSIAKLYQEHENNSNAKYSFANYLEQNNSYINLENFWTPFLDPEKTITNNIELGAPDKEKCALITGPNAGGKSTILKAILINALLAQTITITPASICSLTPFSYLDSYLNITDDLSNGNSLFKAEVMRVKDLLFNIENNDKSLVIVDEMFSGTNPDEGGRSSFAITNYIAKLANRDNKILALFATHYTIMTKLEEKTNNIVKNYHVKAFVNKQDQKINYPFKLFTGPAENSVAIDMLEFENFDKSIIEMARAIAISA